MGWIGGFYQEAAYDKTYLFLMSLIFGKTIFSEQLDIAAVILAYYALNLALLFCFVFSLLYSPISSQSKPSSFT